MVNMNDPIFQRYLRNSLLDLFGINTERLRDIFSRWQQPHRHYHGVNHLSTLLARIDELALIKDEAESLELIALFHDVVYDPRSKDNEELSAQFFTHCCNPLASIDEKFRVIKNAILDTKIVLNPNPSSALSSIFLKFDVDDLLYGNVSKVIENEYLIHREFQMFHIRDYREARVKFMDSLMPRVCREDRLNIDIIINFLNTFRPKIGLYAGSFLPFHIGHMNVLEKAEAIFDKVIIAQLLNTDKDEKRSSLNNVEFDLPFHHVVRSGTMLHKLYMDLSKYYDVTLVRGLRNGSDLQYEMNMLRTLQDQIPDIKVIYMVCDKDYEHISSSMYRQIASFNDTVWCNRYRVRKYSYNAGDDLCQPIQHN